MAGKRTAGVGPGGGDGEDREQTKAAKRTRGGQLKDDGPDLDASNYRELQEIARLEGLPRNRSATELRQSIRTARTQASKDGADGATGGQDKKRLKTGSKSKKVVKKPECPTCCDDIEDPEEGFKLESCGKTVHKTCLQRALAQPIGTFRRTTPRCPACNKHNLARTTVELILADNPGLMKAWKHALLNEKHGERLLPCPEPDCDHYHILSKKQVDSRPRTLKLKCGHTFKAPGGKTKEGKKEGKAKKGVKLSKRIKQCPWCGMFVERKGGCDTMHCICHNAWCFTCRSKRAFCVHKLLA